MKTIITGMMALISISAFAKTIKHENCRLHGGFYNSELNMILENKGYTLYSGKIEQNTLNLEIDSDSEEFESHPLSVMACPAQNEKWTKFTDYASVARFDGQNFYTLAQENTNYQACLQSGGEGKAYRSIKRLLNNLPDCEIK
jgi:hypothetical protein